MRYAGSNSSDIVSITPAVDLLDGAVYNFTLEYQDRAGNPVASTINDRVGYSGNHTLTPTFIHPQSNAYVTDVFTISFKLPEEALSGTVKMTFTPRNDISGVADNNAARVIVFHSDFELVGTHTVTTSDFLTFQSNGKIASITPLTNLIDGTKYDVTLSYQDRVGNPISEVSHNEITYVGTFTTNPAMSEPLSSDVVPSTFFSTFTLFEDALTQSIKFTITPADTGVDGNGVRELILTDKLQGKYVIAITGSNFETMLDNNVIIAPFPVNPLVDGAEYSITLSYQDRGGNSPGSISSTLVKFDTTSPTFVSATLNLSTGVLIVAASETLNLDFNDRSVYNSVNQTVHLSQFFVADTTGDSNSLQLNDGTFIDTDGAAITIILSESDRLSALEQSNTTGGDGTPLVVDVLAAAVYDLATNPSLLSLDLPVTESPDIIPPVIIGANIDYDNGKVVFNSNERIDLTPASKVDVSKVFFVK